jgi:hypothetical protein
MHSDRYVHPEFGFLSPTPRLRRELRMAFFSVLFGIGIGAAAVIALSGNNADDARVSHEVAVLGYNSPQGAGTPDGSTAEANSEDHKTNATTACQGDNSSCRNVPPAAS